MSEMLQLSEEEINIKNDHFRYLQMDKREAVLYLYVNHENPELVKKYEEYVSKYNSENGENMFPNSGFDLFVPDDFVIHSGSKTEMVDFQIKIEMQFDQKPSGFYLFPRSSISKTSLMLANHTGIIDSGYRGNIIGAFRNLSSSDDFIMEKHSRILQICHPSLCRIRVVMIYDQIYLSNSLRGSGGFGSTGK